MNLQELWDRWKPTTSHGIKINKDLEEATKKQFEADVRKVIEQEKAKKG